MPSCNHAPLLDLYVSRANEASKNLQPAGTGPVYLHVAGSPWILDVRAACGHASQCAVTDVPMRLIAGQTATFAISIRDAYGNRTSGGDRVEAQIDSIAEGTKVPPLSYSPASRACVPCIVPSYALVISNQM